MTSKKALDRIDWVLHKLADALGVNFSELVENYNFSNEMEIIISLVERDTPKKIGYDDYEEPCCPVCGEVQCPNVYATNNNGCPYCLQRLDWSEENE